MPERRLLRALTNHNAGSGAFATRWKGWVPANRVVNDRGRKNLDHPDGIRDVEKAMGVYAVMYEPTPRSLYVVYVGYSKDLQRELKFRYRDWSKARWFYPRKEDYPFSTLYISNQRTATYYEDFLIRYYCPPWNTRFSRQPHRPRSF
jgi:hypothetical protein